jgi:hypothetical protein
VTAGKTIGSVMNAVGLDRVDIFRLVGRNVGDGETIYGKIAAPRVARMLAATA